ncbi:MAG: pilus assembly protein TadG-related protein [Hyphomicrobiaceae bacterium]
MAVNRQEIFRAEAASQGPKHVQSFRGDECGSIGIFFAVTFMVVMLIVALAVDYGRADLEHSRLQRAADAAALAASHRLGLPDQDESGVAIAQKYFQANMAGSKSTDVKSISLDAAKGEVRIESGKSVFTSIMNAVGIRSMDVNAGSRVVKGDGTVEIALVLDNSGSMAGQPLEDLRSAASHLAKVVFTGADQSDRVKIGIVPFSGAVNVGPGYRSSNWIDKAGLSPLNGVNFDSNTPRLNVFDQLGVAWRGCVEARPAPYDTTDDPPSEGNPETLFVPMFAPDEPDSTNSGGDSYSNNYIADDGGSCAPSPKPAYLTAGVATARSGQRSPCRLQQRKPACASIPAPASAPLPARISCATAARFCH